MRKFKAQFRNINNLTDSMKPSFGRLRVYGLAAGALLLGLIVLGLYASVAPVAWFYGEVGGLLAAAAAAALCLVGAEIALAVSHLFRSPEHLPYRVLFGMAARMGIPLSVGLIIHLQGGVLAKAGLLYYLLVFYPITLAVETVLSLPQVKQAGRY